MIMGHQYLRTLAFTLLYVLLLWGQVVRQVKAAFQLPPFLQSLSEQSIKQKPPGEADRVFSLPASVLNVPNIRRFTPRKKHLKPQKLMRRLRKDWDPFWMSAERPADEDKEEVKDAQEDPSLRKAVERLNFTVQGADGVAGEMEESLAKALGAWLLQHSTCQVRYVWDDLGILYWPRWVRRGYCKARGDNSSSSSASYGSSSIPTLSSSCSWPPGMHCVPAESRRIRILRWQCRHNKAFNNWNPRYRKHRARRPTLPQRADLHGRDKRAVQPSRNQSSVDESNETENWSRKPFKERRRKLSMRCKWKKIPYPVTDDCFCSC